MIKSKYISILLLALLPGCDDFLEPNLTDKQVTLLSPPDGLITTVATQTFWWELVEGAEFYNLQVVSPSFEYVERLYLDSTITNNKFTMTLIPGTYQWRVSALNYSTATEYFSSTFVIDSTPDLSKEIVQLIHPSDKDTSNNILFTFRWMPLYNADDYSFQLFYEGDMVVSTVTEFDTLTVETNFGEGSYNWQVRAQNELSNTIYSSRKFYTDNTAPAKPVLVTPANEGSLADTVITCNWIRDASGGSSIMDSLYIFDSENLSVPRVATYVSSPVYKDSLGPGEYYWKVISIDAAGNKSAYSEFWNFFIIDN